MRPELVAGIALTAFDTALSRWAASDGTVDLDALTDEAFTIVADTLNSPQAPWIEPPSHIKRQPGEHLDEPSDAAPLDSEEQSRFSRRLKSRSVV